MLRSYLNITLRILWRNRTFSVINLLGITVGLASCMTIMLWVLDELSYDAYHKHADRIQRVCVDADFGSPFRMPIIMSPAAKALETDFPEVVKAGRIQHPSSAAVKYNDRLYRQNGVGYADQSILEIFSYESLSGSLENALTAPYQVVITQSVAERYFGEEEPVGKQLLLGGLSDYTITAVIEDIPTNSHLDFNMLCSMSTLEARDPEAMSHWFNIQYHTYLLLADDVDPLDFENKLPGFVGRHMGEMLRETGGSITLFLQPLRSIHLYSNLENEIGINGDIRVVVLFTIIALMTLVMAIINYVNMTTARTSVRAHEVGVRKTFGADRMRLIRQFLGESAVITLCAGIIGLLLVELSLPLFNGITDRELSLSVFNAWPYYLLYLFVLSTVSLSAGIYPALILSRIDPARIFRGHTGLRRPYLGNRLRQILVVIQFTVSITMITGTLVVYSQMKYITTKELGYSPKGVIVISDPGTKVLDTMDTALDEMRRQPGVAEAAVSSIVPGSGYQLAIVHPEGFPEDQPHTVHLMDVDTRYLSMMGIESLSGRSFNPLSGTDADQSIMINESAARLFGWDDPIGKSISMTVRADTGFVWMDRTVIGVLKDFHQRSLHSSIEPMVIGHRKAGYRQISILVELDEIEQSLESLETLWKKLDPSRPFHYYFMDEHLLRMYQAEYDMGQITLIFASLAMLIGCLGLLGLSTFTAERRTKEIGIRKVLGASLSDILRLLSREYLLMVMVSNLIALPIAWYLLRSWLDHYAFRVSLSLVYFAAAMIISLVIALVTVSIHGWRAAVINPVDSLKYE